jgi:hypothetical protein
MDGTVDARDDLVQRVVVWRGRALDATQQLCMPCKGGALEIQSTVNLCELCHDGVEGVSKVGLALRIGGGTERPVVWCGHGH